MSQTNNISIVSNADALPLRGLGGLDLLICTINEGIIKIPSILMSSIEGVRYVVCMQYTDEESLDKVPMREMIRSDVKFYVQEGKGLSKNRNFALDWAEADICVIADDDNRYKTEYFEAIRKTYQEHPEADVICFAAESYDGKPMKAYPTSVMSYSKARDKGYYPTSMEITFKRASITDNGIRFNENFGLGSPKLCAGEEDVFLKDCEDKGLKVLFVPKVIVQSDPDTTGLHFIESKQLQVTKGATFKYLYGKNNAMWRSIKEGVWHLLHEGANPFTIFFNMLRGINMFQ